MLKRVEMLWASGFFLLRVLGAITRISAGFQRVTLKYNSLGAMVSASISTWVDSVLEWFECHSTPNPAKGLQRDNFGFKVCLESPFKSKALDTFDTFRISILLESVRLFSSVLMLRYVIRYS